MNEYFRKAIRGDLNYLTVNISPTTNLWQQLQDKCILTEWQIDICRAEKTDMDKVAKMLDQLKKCNDDDFIPFCNILVGINKAFIAKRLADKVGLMHLLTLNAPTSSDPSSTERSGSAAVDTTTTNATSPSQNFATNVDDEEIDPQTDEDRDAMFYVKPTTEEFYLEHCNEAFPMKSKPRGTALIFNVLRTACKTDRVGTHEDCDNLLKLFEKLHFNVKVYSDIDKNGVEEPDELKPTARNIRRLIKTTFDGITSKEECFVLITLSHGDINEQKQEVILGCDGEEITKSEILNMIAADNKDYRYLKDLPRLVFFQCCRGDMEDTDCSRSRANTLYCHSCRRNYVTYRGRFVRTMVKIFKDHAHDTDIMGLLDKVKAAMENPSSSNGRQVPEYVCDKIFGQRKLYFFP